MHRNLTIDHVHISIEVSGTSPTKLFAYKSCCFRTSALISILNGSNFDQSLLLHVLLPLHEFCFSCESSFLFQGLSMELSQHDLLVCRKVIILKF